MSTNGVKGSLDQELARAMDKSGRATPKGQPPAPRKKKGRKK